MQNNNRGFTLIEIIVAIAIITVVFSVLLGISFSVLNILGSAKKEARANDLIEETFESLRNFRNATEWQTGLGALAVGEDNPYHLATSSANWTVVAGMETIEDPLCVFMRKIILNKISRNPATDDIEPVYNQANNDADTRKVTVVISWPQKTVQVETYLTNWK